MTKPIFVTRPTMPPLEEFHKELEKIWESGWITNMGIYHENFEKSLCKFLGVEYISLFSNGTLALITALQSLSISGEVITTPFSFVATAHALYWNNIRPVFVDIDPNTFNIDPAKIEAAITPQTTAILPVHVYGNPCNIEAIEKIAEDHQLKVIYDAAHAFGVSSNNKSILNSGDLSVLSFHATKVFNTIEGGAVVCHSASMKKKIDFLKNFGFADEVTVVGPGINAKMNELQAAYGLLQLKYLNKYIQERKQISEKYIRVLGNIPGIGLIEIPDDIQYNYSYFPIFVDKKIYGISRDQLFNRFRNHEIYVRRYFYPLISQFPTYKDLLSSAPENLPVSEITSRRVICLPIFPGLENDSINKICGIIIESSKYVNQ